MLASAYCPSYELTENIYLKQGTAGTADAAAVMPAELHDQTCSVHYNWWNWFFPVYEEPYQEPAAPQQPTAPGSEEQVRGNPLLDWFLSWQD